MGFMDLFDGGPPRSSMRYRPAVSAAALDSDHIPDEGAATLPSDTGIRRQPETPTEVVTDPAWSMTVNVDGQSIFVRRWTGQELAPGVLGCDSETELSADGYVPRIAMLTVFDGSECFSTLR